jgi:hypothetical protein
LTYGKRLVLVCENQRLVVNGILQNQEGIKSPFEKGVFSGILKNYAKSPLTPLLSGTEFACEPCAQGIFCQKSIAWPPKPQIPLGCLSLDMEPGNPLFSLPLDGGGRGWG